MWLRFDSAKEKAYQSQRRKWEVGLAFDSTRGYAKLSQRKEQEAQVEV